MSFINNVNYTNTEYFISSKTEYSNKFLDIVEYLIYFYLSL